VARRAPPERSLRPGALILTIALLSAPVSGAEPERVVEVPPVDVALDMMKVRHSIQLQSLAGVDVLHDFSFEDRVQASGIGFVHRVVADAGRDYKPVHYDHGNGVAAADVDGDRRLDLYFVNQLGANGLWRGLGDGSFEDVTAAAGVGLEDRICVAAAFADVDNDGDPDLFVTSVREGNVLFVNDGTGRFADRTTEMGLEYRGHSSGAVFFDYDGDSWLDLLVTNVGRYTTEQKGPGGYWVGLTDAFEGHLHPSRAERSLLYRNVEGRRFVDVTDEVGLDDEGWTGDAAFADLDGDGYPDLYLPNMQGDDHFYRNLGGKRFEERTSTWFPRTPWGTMGIEFLDFDNDGNLDLYLTDMHSDMVVDVTPGFEKVKATWIDPTHEVWQGGSDNLFGNALYQATGDGGFVERSDELGVETYWPWGVSAGDLNADGWLDLVVTAGMNFPFRYGLNSVLLNVGGRRFVDAELALGVEPRRRVRVPWFEVDCGGLDPTHPLCARGLSGRFTVAASSGSRSSVILDLDNDGDLDIVTGELNAPPQVLVSDLAATTTVRSLEVRLRGTASNRDGLGAWVTVRAAGHTLLQYHDGKSGYLAQSSMPLYFGLGDAEVVEEVGVRWPSGRRSVVTAVPAGSFLEVVEPDEAVGSRVGG
jgi:hypothetical protein